MLRPYRYQDVIVSPLKGLSGMGSVAPYPLAPSTSATDSEGNTMVNINPFGMALTESNTPGELSFSPMLEWVTGNANFLSNADIGATPKVDDTLTTFVRWFERNKLWVGLGVGGFLLIKLSSGRGRR